MAHKVYRTRFPISKLRKKSSYKKRQHQISRPRGSGRGQQGISRRKV